MGGTLNVMVYRQSVGKMMTVERSGSQKAFVMFLQSVWLACYVGAAQ